MLDAFSGVAGFVALAFVAPVAFGVIAGIVGSRLSRAVLARSGARSLGTHVALALATAVAAFLTMWFLASTIVPTQGDQTGIVLRLGWLVLGMIGTVVCTGIATLLAVGRAAQRHPAEADAPQA